jgi:type 1 fimbriae regulatory protein FimB/type 1 fimbriae regulatory protein FimE
MTGATPGRLQHYLGHKSIQHTVRYTKLSPDRFRDFWRD